jgi:alkanesulfonate monooxygenase SsuD/methylene tetrahydromethanopterin reductase-like flavin-dependent oxidoreductase (luciferase family)
MRMITRQTEAEAQAALQALGGGAPGQRAAFIAGTPEQCAEALLPYRRIGVGDFLLGTRVPYDWETLELVAQEVAPLVRSA